MWAFFRTLLASIQSRSSIIAIRTINADSNEFICKWIQDIIIIITIIGNITFCYSIIISLIQNAYIIVRIQIIVELIITILANYFSGSIITLNTSFYYVARLTIIIGHSPILIV